MRTEVLIHDNNSVHMAEKANISTYGHRIDMQYGGLSSLCGRN